tara:strand:- start:48713 stop:50359 length:1647 start_codon:yes stop_codon:yes gene_type:complete
MSGDKETPRQAMIGMMYLVLLALLAMNVSKSVLNSFIVINGAMEETNKAFDEKNGETLGAFENQYGQNPEKVGEFYFAAKRVVEASEKLNEYMMHLKHHIIEHTEGKTPEEMLDDSMYLLTNVEAVDNIDMPSHVLLGNDEMNPASGEFTMLELKEKIKDWKREMMAEVPASAKGTYNLGFNYEDVKQTDGTYLSWELAHFYHAPLAAVITDITIFQTEVKNREAEVLKMLMSNISAKDFKFDKVEVKVIPNSNYVVLGDSFKADVIVAAYSTTENPILEVGSALDTAGKAMNEWGISNAVDTGRIKVNNGVASYGYKPTSEGEVKWGGIIKLKKPGTNEFVMYPFEHSFIAAKPSLVVSPTKMNVMYRSLKNPIDVSVSGFSASELIVTASGGTLSGSNGAYFVTPGNSSRKVQVNVSVKTETGTKSMGSSEFRVKSIPKPTPKFATVVGSGRVSLPQLKAAQKVTVELEDFMFDGIKYVVKSFDMVGYVKGKKNSIKSNSDRVSSKQQILIKNQKSKSQIVIKNIWVVGPSGQKELIPGNVVVDIK